MNMTKSHRIVLVRGAFNRIAALESGAAMECAENEGWPIEDDLRELPHAVANAGVIALACGQAGGNVGSGVGYRPENGQAIAFIRTQKLRLHARMQS